MSTVIIDIFNQHLLNSIPFDQVLEEEKKYYHLVRSYWQENNYLTPQWWLLVILSILSPIIWLILVDKKRITEITTFGLFYGISAVILDSIGSNAMFWTYIVSLSPYLHPQMYPYDIGIVIVPFMLVYQKWGNDFKKFLLYTGCLSAFLSFIAEPFMEWLKIYREFSWRHFYSFPIYWILGFVIWVIIKQFKKCEQQQ